MINRMIKAGTDLNNPNWKEESIHIKGLGGTVTGNYQVLLPMKNGKMQPDYESIMDLSNGLARMKTSSNLAIADAFQAFSAWGKTDYSNGAISWSASPPPGQPGTDSNFQRAAQGIFIILPAIGNTTFFKFK